MPSLFRFFRQYPTKHQAATKLFNEMKQISVKTAVVTMPTAVYRNRRELSAVQVEVTNLQLKFDTARLKYDALVKTMGPLENLLNRKSLAVQKRELDAHGRNVAHALFYLNHNHRNI